MSSARSIEHTLSPPARRCIRQIHVIPPHFLDAARRPPTPSSSSSSKPPPIRFIFPRKRRNELCSSPALSSSSSPRSVPSLPPSPIAARAAAAVAAAAPPVLPSWSEAAYRVVFWDAENLSIPPDAISQVRRLLDINSPADSDRPLLVQEYRSQTMYERGEREKLRSMGIRSVGFRYNGIPGGQQADELIIRDMLRLSKEAKAAGKKATAVLVSDDAGDNFRRALRVLKTDGHDTILLTGDADSFGQNGIVQAGGVTATGVLLRVPPRRKYPPYTPV